MLMTKNYNTEPILISRVFLFHRHRFDGNDSEGKAKSVDVSSAFFALSRVCKGTFPFAAGLLRDAESLNIT